MMDFVRERPAAPKAEAPALPDAATIYQARRSAVAAAAYEPVAGASAVAGRAWPDAGAVYERRRVMAEQAAAD